MKKALLIAASAFCLTANAQIISTFAGGGSSLGDGGQATAGSLTTPNGVALDAAGNLYIADYNNNRIRMVTTAGIITTVAGNGNYGFSGDGGQATAAKLNNPTSVVLDAAHNLYIADYTNMRVRKVTTAGIITTVAGNGSVGFTGDGGQATAAEFYYPSGVTVSASGNLYIADSYNNRIRKVTTAGIITTVAGNGTQSFSGDGGQANVASLAQPSRVICDAAGNLYISDWFNVRIRKVNTAGVISTIAGNGTSGVSGDGAAATSAEISRPGGVNFDAAGNLYIADNTNNRIRMVTTAGIISTVAGYTTATGFSGDGGPAIAAKLYAPMDVAIDATGAVFIADMTNNRIRKVSCLLTINVNSGIMCPGQSFTISATGANTYSYSGGTSVVTPTATSSYTVIGTSNAGCMGSAVSTVTVPTAASIAANDTSLCAGEMATLTAAGINTYTWNTGSSTSTISASPTVNTTYTVSGTGLGGCVLSASLTLNVANCAGLACFYPPNTYSAGTGPSDIINADFNGDGIQDLATANNNNFSGNTVSVLLGTGGGIFGAPTNFTVGVGPAALTSADFNGDGNLDLAASNAAYNGAGNTVSVLLGTGTGNFGTATSFTVGSGPTSIVSADFNGDGKKDLATANQGSSGYGNTVSIILGTGTGSFGAATSFTVGTNPYRMVTADFNNDGKADLAASLINYNGFGNTVAILLGTGTGSFGAPASHVVGTEPNSLITKDFNGDGKADLATTNVQTSNSSVLLGTGTGSFAPAVTYTTGPAGSNNSIIASGDFNLDGKLDLAVRGYVGSPGLGILFGTGAGTFGPVNNYTMSPLPGRMISADLNGDGKADIAGLGNNNVVVILSCATTVNIEEYALNNKIHIYPNPASTILNVELKMQDKTNIQITNMLGQGVIQTTIQQGKASIDISNLQPGVYFIQTTQGTQKFIKE